MGVLVLIVAVAGSAASTQSAVSRQIKNDNVAAFARVYGVVRYFYPGDAAAALDWNRFAVHGVARVRGASDPAALAATLEELFAPLGAGIIVGTTLPNPPPLGPANPALVAWRYTGPGGTSTSPSIYTAGRTNRAGPADPNVFVAMLQTIAAEEYRGRTIRLRARARVAKP